MTTDQKIKEIVLNKIDNWKKEEYGFFEFSSYRYRGSVDGLYVVVYPKIFSWEVTVQLDTGPNYWTRFWGFGYTKVTNNYKVAEKKREQEAATQFWIDNEDLFNKIHSL